VGNEYILWNYITFSQYKYHNSEHYPWAFILLDLLHYLFAVFLFADTEASSNNKTYVLSVLKHIFTSLIIRPDQWLVCFSKRNCQLKAWGLLMFVNVYVYLRGRSGFVWHLHCDLQDLLSFPFLYGHFSLVISSRHEYLWKFAITFKHTRSHMQSSIKMAHGISFLITKI
jgi:hypothetical protein